MKLSLLATLNTFTGHGVHTLNIARYLPEMLGCELVIRPIKTAGEIPDFVTQRVKAGANDAEFEIYVGPPTVAPTHGKRTVYCTTVESTRPAPKTIQLLNMAEIVVVPSQFCATVLSANGVTRPIYVVPLGFSEAFDYRPMPKTMPFTFACAGQLTNGPTRKGLQRVIDLFEKAFPNREEVALNVKCAPGDPPLMIGPKRVDVWRNVIAEEDRLADWLAQCHCFINIGTEGFGLWPLQAMAIGRPVISPAYGGVTEFLNTENALTTGYHTIPAGDSWKGLGDWAEADGGAAVAAMRHAYGQRGAMTYLGWKAHQSVTDFTWPNSIRKLADIIKAHATPAPVVIESKKEDERLTVCITSFKRYTYLERAIKSCYDAGIERVVVVTMAPDSAVLNLLKRFQQYAPAGWLSWTALETDLGCNELWLQCAYRSETERLIILHDDDYLDPSFGDVYRKELSPRMSEGRMVTWRARNKWDNGKWATADYVGSMTGVAGSVPMESFHKIILDPQRLSLSPIVTIFRKTPLIRALKECAENLTRPESFWHPEMLLGTEIVAHYRNSQAAKGWFYWDTVLAYYGTHDESGTMKALKTKQTDVLHRGYNLARTYCRENPVPKKVQPRIIFVFNDYPATGDAKRRNDYAMSTWSPHFNSGEMLPLTVSDAALPRTSADVGDDKPVPYIKDLFDLGAAMAQEEDIIVYANRDICLTQDAAEKIRESVAGSNGICCAIRRNIYRPLQPGKIYKTVLNCWPDNGIDLFAVTPKWWREHREKIPDLLIGREAWDAVFRWMAADELPAGSTAFLMDDVIYHEFHDSMWIKERTTNKGQLHNRELARKFFTPLQHSPNPWVANAAAHILYLLNDETWKPNDKRSEPATKTYEKH